MEKKKTKEFIQNEISKRFIEAMKWAIDKHLATNYRDIADAIGWTESSISSVKAGGINVPIKYIKTFEEKYKTQILFNIDSSDIQNRLLRIESHLEVFLTVIAGLSAKKTQDFAQKFSELQTMIQEAVMRRKQEQGA